MYSVARGSTVGGKHAERGDVLVELLRVRSRLRIASFSGTSGYSSAARALILSSTSVMLRA